MCFFFFFFFFFICFCVFFLFSAARGASTDSRAYLGTFGQAPVQGSLMASLDQHPQRQTSTTRSHHQEPPPQHLTRTNIAQNSTCSSHLARFCETYPTFLEVRTPISKAIWGEPPIFILVLGLIGATSTSQDFEAEGPGARGVSGKVAAAGG